MDEALVFHNPQKGSCPIYIQDDVSVGLIKPTKDLIENFGGLVAEDPQKAIIIVIIDRNTHLGSKLIMDYAGVSSVKGVVDQVWTLESIRKGRMLGPPDWGGFALHRHTTQTYFEDSDENTSSAAHTASPVTVNAGKSLMQPIDHTALPSSGSSGYFTTPRDPTRPSALQKSTTPQKLFLPQQTPSKQSTTSASRNRSAPLLKSTNASQPQRATNHIRHVRIENGLQQEEAHPHTEDANSTPQPPSEEDSQPLGKSGRFFWTDAEVSYVRARVERTQAEGPVPVSVLGNDISKAIPWHSPTSVASFIHKKQWNKELSTRKTFPAKGMKSGLNRPPQGTSPVVGDIDTLAQERSRDSGSPSGDDENQSSAEEIIDASDAESENRSTCEPPPEAPPRHNKHTKDGKYAYTDADREFVIKYLAWAERTNMSPGSSIYLSMTELMPWHSAGSIQSFVSKTPNILGKRDIPSKGSQRPLGRASFEYRQQQTADIPSAPGTGPRQSEDAEPRTPSGLSIVKDRTSSRIDKRAQTASSAKGKAPSALSEAVIEAMVHFLKDNPESHWARDNSKKRARLWSDFAKLHPNHSAESYYQYHIQHHKQLESAVWELMEDQPCTDGHSGRRSGIRRSVNSIIGSLVEEGKLEEPVTCLTSKSGDFFDQKDCLVVIQYLADNPRLFYGPVKVPPGATSTKIALWEKFTAKHKTRSRWSWTEFHSIHRAALENAAQKLISIRQAREGRDDLQEPSSSSTVHTTVNGQPGTLTSTGQPTRPGFLSRFQNLLKRSFQDDPGSSGPSKRIKLEESLP